MTLADTLLKKTMDNGLMICIWLAGVNYILRLC